MSTSRRFPQGSILPEAKFMLWVTVGPTGRALQFHTPRPGLLHNTEPGPSGLASWAPPHPLRALPHRCWAFRGRIQHTGGESEQRRRQQQ